MVRFAPGHGALLNAHWGFAQNLAADGEMRDPKFAFAIIDACRPPLEGGQNPRYPPDPKYSPRSLLLFGQIREDGFDERADLPSAKDTCHWLGYIGRLALDGHFPRLSRIHTSRLTSVCGPSKFPLLRFRRAQAETDWRDVQWVRPCGNSKRKILHKTISFRNLFSGFPKSA